MPFTLPFCTCDVCDSFQLFDDSKLLLLFRPDFVAAIKGLRKKYTIKGSKSLVYLVQTGIGTKINGYRV